MEFWKEKHMGNEQSNRGSMPSRKKVWLKDYPHNPEHVECPVCRTSIMRRDAKKGDIDMWENSHFKPYSRGGVNELCNLYATCFDCNRQGQDMTIFKFAKRKHYIVNREIIKPCYKTRDDYNDSECKIL